MSTTTATLTPRKHAPGDISRTSFCLRSEEGLEIRGVIERPPKARAMVLLLHGFKGFKRWGFFPWLAEELNHAGAATCRFDFSRSGVSHDGEIFDRLDLFRDDTYSAQLSDFKTVVDYIAQQRYLEHLPISILGYSRGGAIALLGAPSVPRLKSVATWSSISSVDRWDEATVAQWRRDGYVDVLNSRTGQMMRMSTALLDDFEKNRDRFNVLEAARKLSVPTLFVHGMEDETVPFVDSQKLAEASPLSSLLLVPRASHTFGAIHPLVDVPEQLLLAARVTSRFFVGY